MQDHGKSVDLTFDPDLKGHATIELVGEIDAAIADEIRQLAARSSEATYVVVDLTGVTFMDSTGLGAVITVVRSITHHEAEVHIVCSEGPIRRLIHTTGVDQWATSTREVR